MTDLDTRLLRLKSELDDHARIARHLGLDLERPIQSLGDGYPENAIAWVGKITERLLKQLWRHHNVPGTPAGKALKDLIAGCRPHIRSHTVIEALQDIQRLRNRSAHDGHQVADEDGLTAVRRLLDILSWYTSTGSGALSGHAPRLVVAVAVKAELLTGLYLTLGYKPAKRFDLSRHTVYQLLVRERGPRSEYVELIVSRDAGDVVKVLEVTGGELLQTTLPKLTRFLVLEESGDGQLPESLREDCRVVTYDHFMDAFVDLGRHLNGVSELYPRLDAAVLPVSGDLLTADTRSGQMQIAQAGTASAMLERIAADGGNLLIVGRPGSGKTTLLKQLVAAASGTGTRRYRFFLDLSLKRKDETFAEFATRMLTPYIDVEAAYVFPAFCYFARTGLVMCALDGLDEAVSEMTQAGFLNLFAEVTEVLTAESAVIMTSRVSFLEDSPQVRRLLDGTHLMSERLIQQLHAQGVDPLRVPRFSVLRLRDTASGVSLLEAQLAGQTPHAVTADAAGIAGPADLGDLLWQQIAQIAEPSMVPRLVDVFGRAFLRGVTTFTLADLVNALGITAFENAHVDPGSFRLRSLFRPAGPEAANGMRPGDAIAFRHVAYQELLAAEFLRTAEGRADALAATPRPRLTEQVRQFLRDRSDQPASGDCILPAGAYVVGPSHHLMLRRIEHPVRFDRFSVTVARYKRFLDAVTRHGSAQWDHPAMPTDYGHQPARERLRIPDYYNNPAFENHPAVAVSWWSACAFARFEGKRLPTSLEWEAAARGHDGRLFPWGDAVDTSVVNCADSWSEHSLITYEAWRQEIDQGRLKEALPGPVNAHPANVSPFGIREMAGNVWEFTATVLEDLNEAVICGGSFDNPYRAIQASSKGTYRRCGASNAVGFRCVEDLK